jgi:hypothetical protein
MSVPNMPVLTACRKERFFRLAHRIQANAKFSAANRACGALNVPDLLSAEIMRKNTNMLYAPFGAALFCTFDHVPSSLSRHCWASQQCHSAVACDFSK